MNKKQTANEKRLTAKVVELQTVIDRKIVDDQNNNAATTRNREHERYQMLLSKFRELEHAHYLKCRDVESMRQAMRIVAETNRQPTAFSFELSGPASIGDTQQVERG